MRVSVLVSAALLSLLPLACGDSNPPPNDPSQNQYAGQNGQYPPGQYPPGQYQPTPTNSVPTAPATQTVPPATTGAAAGQAQPMAPAMLTGADLVLGGLAQQEVPGMQPDGTSFGGQFQEGQILEQPINLQPGKCYSVVAGSLGGVQELDVMIQGQLAPLPPATFAQDNQTGPNATLGGKAAGCWKNPSPVPIPAKVVLRATKGAGAAAAKVYVK